MTWATRRELRPALCGWARASPPPSRGEGIGALSGAAQRRSAHCSRAQSPRGACAFASHAGGGARVCVSPHSPSWCVGREWCLWCLPSPRLPSRRHAQRRKRTRCFAISLMRPVLSLELKEGRRWPQLAPPYSNALERRWLVVCAMCICSCSYNARMGRHAGGGGASGDLQTPRGKRREAHSKVPACTTGDE